MITFRGLYISELSNHKSSHKILKKSLAEMPVSMNIDQCIAKGNLTNQFNHRICSQQNFKIEGLHALIEWAHS